MEVTDLDASLASDLSVLELPPTPPPDLELKPELESKLEPEPEPEPEQRQRQHSAVLPVNVQASLNLAVGALLTPRAAEDELSVVNVDSELQPEIQTPQPEPEPEPEPEKGAELVLTLPKKKKKAKKPRPNGLQIGTDAVAAADDTVIASRESKPEPHLQEERDEDRRSHPRSRPEPENEPVSVDPQLSSATAAQIEVAKAFETAADWPGAVSAYETALASSHPSAARSEILCGLQRARSAAARQASSAISQTLPRHRDASTAFAKEMEPEIYAVELEFEAPSGAGRHHHRVVLAESRFHVQSDSDWQEVGHEFLKKDGESAGGWWRTLPPGAGGQGVTAPPPPAFSKISMDYIPARTQLLRFTLVGGVTTYQNWRAGRTIGRSDPISLEQIVASRLKPMEAEAIRHVRADRHMALHRLLAVGKCSVDTLWDGHSLLWLARDLGSLASVVLLEQHGARSFNFGSSVNSGPGGGRSEAPAAVSLPPLAHTSPVWEYLPYRVEQLAGKSQGDGWIEFSAEQSSAIEHAVTSGSQTLIRMFHHGHHYVLDPVSLIQERPGYKIEESHTRKPGDEPTFVVELIRRRPWPVLLVGGALREGAPDVGIGRKDIVVEKAEKPLLVSQMARHPDRAISMEFAEVKAGVARFARQFARYEQGYQGESTTAKDSWSEVWLPNPHTTSDMPERHVVYTGGPAWEPWKPSLDDLQLRGGEWAMIAERVEKLVDRCYGARLSVLRELGLSLPKAEVRRRADGTQYYGQLQPRVFPRWSSAQEKQRVRERETRPSGGAWELSMQVPGNDIMGAKGDKPQQPDYWRGGWPPVAGPIPVQPSGRTDRREALPPRIASSEGDQERLEGHGRLTLASGEVYEGDCSESRRVIAFTDGVYFGEIAEESTSSTANGASWDGGGAMRHGQGRFVTTSSVAPNGGKGVFADDETAIAAVSSQDRHASASAIRVMEGEWVRDRIIGHGSSERDFERRRPKGRLEYSDGSLYYGEFVAAGGNGVLVRHGRGRQMSVDGTLHVGRWDNDRLVEREDDNPDGDGSWASGAYGKGTLLVDDDSIGRAAATPKQPFWHAKPPPPVHHVEPDKGWNVLLDSAEEDDAGSDRHSLGAAAAEHLRHAGPEEREDDDFSALVNMLGGASSARTHEILSIAAGFHAPAAAVAARTIARETSPGAEATALLHEIARGAASCGVPVATAAASVGAE